MGTLTVVENVSLDESLDGVMQGPGRADEDTRDGFDRGGWAFRWLGRTTRPPKRRSRDDEHAGAAVRPPYLPRPRRLLALGEAGPNPFADILRSTPEHVVSSTLTEPLPHPASHLLAGDPVTSVGPLLEETDGEVVVLGSGMLVRALAAADPVDEYVLTVVPVVLGRATRLFDETPAELEPIRATASARAPPSGATASSAEPCARPAAGLD